MQAAAFIRGHRCHSRVSFSFMGGHLRWWVVVFAFVHGCSPSFVGGRAVCMVLWWAFGSFVGRHHRGQSHSFGRAIGGVQWWVGGVWWCWEVGKVWWWGVGGVW